MYNDWRDAHYCIMVNAIAYLGSISNGYILKGGTALFLGYGLTRFSEDIDLDGVDMNFVAQMKKYCMCNGYDIRVAKDTNTVKRVFIHYGGKKPLKIEVSYRNSRLDSDCVDFTVSKRVGIGIYCISYMMMLKTNAFSHRDKLRDLYDVVFIYRNYYTFIEQSIIRQFRDVVAYKGLEQFDFLIKDQKDDLIDNDELMCDFLEVYYDLGLQ